MSEKELISEALRWANGHPNRRSSELMRALADALESRQPGENDREATEAEIDKAARALHMAKCCSLSGDSPHDFPEASELFAAGVVLNAVPRAVVPDAATEARIERWMQLVGKGVEERMDAEAERDAALAAIERVTRAKLEVDSVHQFHGNDCLCGFSSARSRSRTEHITGALLAALDGAPEPDNGCGTCFTCIERVVSAKPFPHNLEYPFIACAECWNKRCPKAENHVNACTGSNEPGQPGAMRYGGLPVEGEKP